MEVCGSIYSNTDYTQFHLKCLYCAVESEIKNWVEFMQHMRDMHSSDDGEADSIKSENDLKAVKMEEEYYVYSENSNIDDQESLSQENMADNDYFDIVDEKAETSPTANAAPGSPASQSIVELDEYNELDICTDEGINQSHGDSENNAMKTLIIINQKFTDEDVNIQSSSLSESSDEEHEENRLPRSKNNPLTLKRKLKISFIRHNPRVLHFIQEYKSHPCLWNATDPNFEDASACSAAYKSLIEVMDKKANVLFTETELKKSICQLLDQFALAEQKASENSLIGIAARYYNKCKFLAALPSSSDFVEEENKTDLIQLNFKEINSTTSVFIDIYAECPVLYDSSLEEFKSIEARVQAYIKMSDMLAMRGLHVNDTEVHLAVLRLRKWAFMTLRRVKSKELRRTCTKSELHYLQMCSFLPPKSDVFSINCEICDKRFYIDYSLRAHMVKAHKIGEFPYECSQCPRRFVKAHDMERHKLRQHCEKMLKCHYCSSTFSLNSDLKVHERVHTGEKPYVCELCGSSFRLKLLLDYHINGRHLDLRPFACDLCPKKYRKRVQLKNHMKGHMNIKDKKCDMCDSAFTCPTSLSRHRKTHYVRPRTKVDV